MKRTASLIILTFLLTSITSISSGQKSDLAGKWKLDISKSTIAGEWPLLVGLTITIKGDSLLTYRTYQLNDVQQYPFSEALALDNKEVSMTIYDMPRKIKAAWSDTEGVLQFISTTTFYGNSGAEDFVSTEKWKVDKAAKTLSINFTNKTSAGEVPGVLVYNKE